MVHSILAGYVPALKARGLFRHEMMLERGDLLHFQLKSPVAGCLLVRLTSVRFHGCYVRKLRVQERPKGEGGLAHADEQVLFAAFEMLAMSYPSRFGRTSSPK
jgi:hypothetical protein